MPLPRNLTKERMKAGKPCLGVGVFFGSPAFVEMLAYAGFHWMYIDCEHGPMSHETVESMIRAAEVAGITPLVRPPRNESQTILRYLDMGAQGMLVPHIETRADAEAAVRYCKYAPEGERGLAGVRWAKFGSAGPLKEAVKEENDRVIVMALIESAKGVENLPEIIRVPGVDIIQIGPSDLGQSLGYVGDSGAPLVHEYIDRIINTCLAAGKPVGIGASNVENARKLLARGVPFVNLSARDLVVGAGRAFVQGTGVE
ncbi:MAG: aldolase/citrate lyase family protein [Chloroflexi bacterium]|nr:aldolase/citrate lyase family protein [Chloroflexota bacterium]